MSPKPPSSYWTNFTDNKDAKSFYGKVVVFKTNLPYYGNDNDAAASPKEQKNLWSLTSDSGKEGSEFVGFVNPYDLQNNSLAFPSLDVLLKPDSVHSSRFLSADAFTKAAKGHENAFLLLRAATAHEITKARETVGAGSAVIVYSSERFRRQLTLG